MKKSIQQSNQLHEKKIYEIIRIKLGLNVVTECDPLTVLKKFSSTASIIMQSDSMTIGLIENPDEVFGRFCTTTLINDHIETVCSDTCELVDTVLLSLSAGHTALRYKKSSMSQLIKSESINAFSNAAFLGVPIQSTTHKYGVIYFLGKRDSSEFNKDDEQLAIIMAAELAVLYENIKRYDNLQQNTRKLQREIIERKNIEKALQNNEVRLKLALEIGNMNGWDWNLQTNEIKEFGPLIPLTRAATNPDWTSYDNFLSRVVSEDREKVIKLLNQSIRESKYLDMEFRSILSNNSIEWISVRGQPFYDEHANPLCMVGVGVIITNNKKEEVQARLRQTKLAQFNRENSMGVMASTLAHELTQPLTAINAYISGCIRRIQAGEEDIEPIIKTMKNVMHNVELAEEVTHRMKNFAMKTELYVDKVIVNELIDEVISLIHYENLHNSPIKFIFDCSETSPIIQADGDQIKQVLLNIFHNSIESLREAKTENPTIKINIEQKDAKYIIIRIENNGPSINPKIIDLLFTPFFTTKPEGMGMGLAICRSIINAHGGQITAENLPDGDVCFQFNLPYIPKMLGNARFRRDDFCVHDFLKSES